MTNQTSEISEFADPACRRRAARHPFRWALVVLCSIASAACDRSGMETASPSKSPDSSPSSGSVSDSRSVTLLAAASAIEAAQDLGERFERKTGIQVRVSAGASNALARQILSGAPADLFLSANEKWAAEIERSGRATQVVPLLSNRLVIVVPRGNPARIRQPSDLGGDAVRQIALAGEAVPAGLYADQALQSLGLSKTLAESGRIVRGQDVRATLSYVEQGEVEAGIVYATDARLSSAVEIAYTFDSATHDPIRYLLVLIKREESSDAARQFFDFLASDEAAERFQHDGFAMARQLDKNPPNTSGEP